MGQHKDNKTEVHCHCRKCFPGVSRKWLPSVHLNLELSAAPLTTNIKIDEMVWANPQKLQSLIASAATAKPHCILSDWQNLQKLQPLDASSALGNPQPPVSSPSAKPSSLQPPQCWECSSVPAPSLVSYVTCAAASPWISTAKSVEEKSLFLVRAQWGAPL